MSDHLERVNCESPEPTPPRSCVHRVCPNVPTWMNRTDPRLLSLTRDMIYASMMIGSRSLVLVPSGKTLSEFIEMLRTTYGPVLTHPDPCGLNYINTIGSNGTCRFYLNMRSTIYRAFVTVNGLSRLQASTIYYQLVCCTTHEPNGCTIESEIC